MGEPERLKLARTAVEWAACPTCGQPVGVDCIRVDMTPLLEPHAARQGASWDARRKAAR